MYLPFPLVLMLSISKWYTMLGQDSLSCPHCHLRALSHQLYNSKARVKRRTSHEPNSIQLIYMN